MTKTILARRIQKLEKQLNQDVLKHVNGNITKLKEIGFSGYAFDLEAHGMAPALQRVVENTSDETTTQIMSDEIWNKLDNLKTKEQLDSIKGTNFYQLSSTKHIFERNLQNFAAQKSKDKENVLNWFSQYILLPQFTFSVWLTFLFSNQMAVIFDYYFSLWESIEQDAVRNMNWSEHLDGYGYFRSDVDDVIYYNEETRLFLIIHDKKVLWFVFKKIELNVHTAQTPGMSILLQRFENAKFLANQGITEKTFEDLAPSFLLFLGNNDQDDIISLIAKEVGMRPEDYKDMLHRCDNNEIYIARNTNKLFLAHSFQAKDGDKEPFIKVQDIDTNELTSTQYLKLKNGDSEINISDIFYTGDKPLDMYDKYYNYAKEGTLGYLLLILYIDMLGFNQPVKVYSKHVDKKRNYVTVPRQTHFGVDNLVDFNKKKEHLYLYDKNYEITDSKKYYSFKKLGDKKNLENPLDINPLNKTNYEILTEARELVLGLICSMQQTRLKLKQLKFIARFFHYSNQSAYKSTNVNMLAILKLINKHAEYKDFIPVLVARYGGNANIICSLFLFRYQVMVSKAGVELIYDSNLFYIKDSYWINTTKEISAYVKTRHVYKGNILTVNDFLNLQGLENYTGSLGSDGKSATEIVSQRVYVQHRKRIVNNSLNNKAMSNLKQVKTICEKVGQTYFGEVIDKVKGKDKWNGVVQLIKVRATYGTDSGSGGLASQFGKGSKDYNKILEQDETFVPNPATKNTAFSSEDDLWFERVLFDLPCTLCDMIQKRKENGKVRYIYSVYAPHYIMSSVILKTFEPFLNSLGVTVIQDESDMLTHNFAPKDRGSIYNCVDYSEYNDQHEVEHKVIVWESLEKMVEAKGYLQGKQLQEFKLCIKWLKTACYKVFIRVKSDNSVIYEHRGRLMSGERATTLINSLLSVFYFLLISINMFKALDTLKELEWEERLVWEALQLEMFNGELEFKNILIFHWILRNECLGDDNKTVLTTLIQAAAFNEMAIHSGLMLKLSKCLIGINMSEFLRRIEIEDESLITINGGYVNRTIASFVAGNVEGSTDRRYDSQINQVYEMCSLIISRSQNNTKFMIHIFEELWEKITKINQENQEINKTYLDIRPFYMSKEHGGWGYIRFDGCYFRPKKDISLPNPPKPEFMSKANLDDITCNAIVNRLQTSANALANKYDTNISEAGLAMSISKAKLDLVKTANSNTRLYPEGFSLLWEEYCVKIKQKDLKKNGKFIQYFKIESRHKEMFSRMINFFKLEYRGEMGLKHLLTVNTKRIDAFVRELDLIDLQYLTKEEMIKREFGEMGYIQYKTFQRMKNNFRFFCFVESATFSSIFTVVYYWCEANNYTYEDAMHLCVLLGLENSLIEFGSQV
jgi:hypothetical protein